MFSCEYYEIFKNSFFTEHVQTTASKKRCFPSIRYASVRCANVILEEPFANKKQAVKIGGIS